MKSNALLVIILAFLTSCNNAPTPIAQATVESTVNPTIASILTKTPLPTITPETTPLSENWETYSNTEYGFSIKYPANLEINQKDHDSLFIGGQIQIWINKLNPLKCRGGCPVYENKESVTLDGEFAIKSSGYIGGDGGTPEQFSLYVVPRNGLYYNFMLHAVGLLNVPADPMVVEPLKNDDIILFEKIIETLEFTNYH